MGMMVVLIIEGTDSCTIKGRILRLKQNFDGFFQILT